MKNIAIIFFFVLSLISGYARSEGKLITSYGAVADGRTNNTPFIQKAIDEVSAMGGGQVVIPPGNFMTGTLFLKSGVDLHLEPGACLLGPNKVKEYLRAVKCAKASANNSHFHYFYTAKYVPHMSSAEAALRAQVEKFVTLTDNDWALLQPHLSYPLRSR